MKKFLFTLAALLMASSAFATCVFYIEDFDIPKDQVNKNVSIDIQADFEEYVSAWQLTIHLPEGLQLVGVKKGADMTLTYTDEFGDEATSAPDITRQGNKLIVAVMVGNYDADGNLYGVAKWGPGHYDQMMILVVKAGEDYAGGEVTLETEFACGRDTRPEIDENRCTNEPVTSEPAIVQFEQTYAPAPTFSYDADTYTMTATCEGYEVELYANGTKVDNPYTVEQTEEEQEIVFSAITLKNEEDNNSPETFYEENPVIVPAKEVVTPDLPGTIVIGDPVAATGQFSVIYLAGDYEGEYTMTVTINGEEAEALSDGVYQAVEGVNEVVVTISATGYNDKTADKTFEWHAPTYAPAPTFSYDADTYTMTATCEDHEVVLYANGTEVSNPYTVEQTNEEQQITFSAITLKNDEDNNSAETFYAQNPVIVPALTPVIVVDKPIYWTSLTDDYLYIFIEVEDEDATLTVLDVDGQEVAALPIAIERPEYDETADPVHAIYTAYATKEGVNSENLMIDEIVPQKAPVTPVDPTAKPELVIDGLTITATGEGTVIIYIDDEEVARGTGEATYTVDPADYPDGAELAVVATAQADGLDVSEPAVGEMEVLATLKGAINFGEVDQQTGKFEVSYNGAEEVTITLDDEEIVLVRDANNVYQLPKFGIYEVTATAAAEGYYDKSKTETLTWTATAPTIETETDDNNNVTVTAEGVGEIVLYQVDDMNGTNPREITNPTTFNAEEEAATYYVYAVVMQDGEIMAASEIKEIKVDAKPADPGTGVNELMNGKAVANVRYFNMAGQEMQEANGVTIVVTTYTDGTTSAVKVMK